MTRKCANKLITVRYMYKFVPVKCIKGPMHRTDKQLSISDKVNIDISITVMHKNNGVDMWKIHKYFAFPFCFVSRYHH